MNGGGWNAPACRRAQEAVLPLWERTRLFRAYSSWLIPGAVQTSATTPRRCCAPSRPGGNCPTTWRTLLRNRTDRLRLLREGDHRFGVLIEESVLRNVIGGPEVMAGQLGHLITVASLPSVSLGIIPMGLDRDAAWPVEDFWIFDDRQVNVELVSGWLTLTQPREITMYGTGYSAALSEIAVTRCRRPGRSSRPRSAPSAKIRSCKPVQVRLPVPRVWGWLPVITSGRRWEARHGTGSGKPGLDGDAGALEELEYHWGSAYHVAVASAVYTATRRDGQGTRLTDASPDGLLRQIRADYSALPVPRNLP